MPCGMPLYDVLLSVVHALVGGQWASWLQIQKGKKYREVPPLEGYAQLLTRYETSLAAAATASAALARLTATASPAATAANVVDESYASLQSNACGGIRRDSMRDESDMGSGVVWRAGGCSLASTNACKAVAPVWDAAVAAHIPVSPLQLQRDGLQSWGSHAVLSPFLLLPCAGTISSRLVASTQDKRSAGDGDEALTAAEILLAGSCKRRRGVLSYS